MHLYATSRSTVYLRALAQACTDAADRIEQYGTTVKADADDAEWPPVRPIGGRR